MFSKVYSFWRKIPDYNALNISHTQKYNFPKIHKFQSNSSEIKLTLELYILFQHFLTTFRISTFLCSLKFSHFTEIF